MSRHLPSQILKEGSQSGHSGGLTCAGAWRRTKMGLSIIFCRHRSIVICVLYSTSSEHYFVDHPPVGSMPCVQAGEIRNRRFAHLQLIHALQTTPPTLSLAGGPP